MEEQQQQLPARHRRAPGKPRTGTTSPYQRYHGAGKLLHASRFDAQGTTEAPSRLQLRRARYHFHICCSANMFGSEFHDNATNVKVVPVSSMRLSASHGRSFLCRRCSMRSSMTLLEKLEHRRLDLVHRDATNVNIRGLQESPMAIITLCRIPPLN